MFVCDIAVGRSYNTYEGSLPTHLCPPPGFDSVIGEVSCLFGGIAVVPSGEGLYDKRRHQPCVPSCLVRQCKGHRSPGVCLQQYFTP